MPNNNQPTAAGVEMNSASSPRAAASFLVKDMDVGCRTVSSSMESLTRSSSSALLHLQFRCSIRAAPEMTEQSHPSVSGRWPSGSSAPTTSSQQPADARLLIMTGCHQHPTGSWLRSLGTRYVHSSRSDGPCRLPQLPVNGSSSSSYLHQPDKQVLFALKNYQIQMTLPNAMSKKLINTSYNLIISATNNIGIFNFLYESDGQIVEPHRFASSSTSFEPIIVDVAFPGLLAPTDGPAKGALPTDQKPN